MSGVSAAKKYLVVSGSRNLSTQGEEKVEDTHAKLHQLAAQLQVEVDCRQFNSEKEMIECLQQAAETYQGAVVNAGSWAHSDALSKAIDALPLPCVEVFISNAPAHEEHHHRSVLAPVCVGVIGGFGTKSYLLGLQALVHLGQEGD